MHRFSALILLLAAGSLQAAPVTIDFEDLDIIAGGGALPMTALTDGYRFDVSSGGGNADIGTSAFFAPGDLALYGESTGFTGYDNCIPVGCPQATIVMTSEGGGTF